MTDKRVIAFFVALPITLCVLMGASYGVFSPGGALSGTWNSQNVNLAAGAPFIAGNLPVANLNSGTGAAAGTYWSGAGTWTTPAGTLTLANPSGLIGMSAVNGVAATAERSDGTHAIDPAIVPTWTGIHTWSSTEPRIEFNETDQGTDLKRWDWDLQGGTYCFRTRTDADGAGQNIFCTIRGATTAISNITLGNATNNPTITLAGTGAVSVAGALTSTNIITALRFVPTSSTAPTSGMYLPAASTVGFATNSTNRVNIDGNGALTFKGALSTTGTTFTASGCSNGTLVGGATAGQFASGTTGVCTVTITLPTAPNGWSCAASNRTTTANLIQQSASSTTSCTVTGTTVTGDVIGFLALGY